MAQSNYFPLYVYLALSIIGIVMILSSGGSILIPLIVTVLVSLALWALGWYDYVTIAWILVIVLIAMSIVFSLVR